MTSRSFFVSFLTGAAFLSSHVVEGFASPPLSAPTGYKSARQTTSTVLRYIAEGAFPNDVKIVDVEIENKSVFIPMQQMEDAATKEQESYEQDAASLQNTINEQREEIERLKELKQKADLTNRLQYDHLTQNAEVNWGENHEDKMKRVTERVRYLTHENQRLQAQLDEERERFDYETDRLQHKLEEARMETMEAEQMLGLERSYFETATRLLEVGLEREVNHAKELEDQLLQYKEGGYPDNYDHPFHEDLPQFETWEATGAYEEQPDPHHQFHHPHDGDEVFEDFQPQVRPHEGNYYYDQGGPMHSEHDVFQYQEAQSFHGQYESQTSPYRRSTATTTVLDADSIRANLGINEIRDPLAYR